LGGRDWIDSKREDASDSGGDPAKRANFHLDVFAFVWSFVIRISSLIRHSNFAIRVSPLEFRPSNFAIRVSPFEFRPSSFAIRVSK
jgi:hypothetical protein